MVSGMTAWHGDPQVVADGEGNVVYVAMADTDAGFSNAQFIVAALSTDGGKSFTQTILVNESNLGSCESGANDEDQPSADFDLTTPSTSARKLSVVWRHHGSGGWGACFRRGTFCKT